MGETFHSKFGSEVKTDDDFAMLRDGDCLVVNVT